jgi:hypothetical protein
MQKNDNGELIDSFCWLSHEKFFEKVVIVSLKINFHNIIVDRLYNFVEYLMDNYAKKKIK